MSDSATPSDGDEDRDEDLFGGEDEQEAVSERLQDLSDAELASDDGADQSRDRDETTGQHRQLRDKAVMAVQIYRHRIPRPQDGTLRSIRVPDFFKFIPEAYDPATFQPSEFDLENARTTKSKQVVRFMMDPDTGKLRSNSTIFQWSDGSVTLSVGGEHYEIQRKSLAPAPDKQYQEVQDGHYYAAAAELSSNLLMVVGHVSEQYTVRPTKAIGDDALSRLAERMAAATQAREVDVPIKITGDPELQRKKAELAEKERLKAQRRRENAQARMESGVGRYAYARSGGLSVGDLEGSSRTAPAAERKRALGKNAQRRAHRSEYDSDDDYPKGQEGYDLEDDFIAPSDDGASEEGGQNDAEDEEEELLEDGRDRSRNVSRRAKRQKTSVVQVQDVDAEGEEDEEIPAWANQDPNSRGRRQTLIDDDD